MSSIGFTENMEQDNYGECLPTRRAVALSALGGIMTILASPQTAAGSSAQSLGKIGKSGPSRVGGALTIDVMQFGARGDGITDDAPAINAAIDAARARQQSSGRFEIHCRIVFPAGVYLVGSSLNLTNLRGVNTVIDGSGSVLVGRCAGQPVIDAFGARWLMMRDLTILGDSTAVPSVGLQIGLLSAHIVASDNCFENVKILGNFALACLYNRSSEMAEFDHLLLWNDQPGSFCLIQDGMNHFNVLSAFAKVSIPRDMESSFNENLFINCAFQHGAGGTPVWLGDTARHQFIRCYSATAKGPSFIIYCGSNSHSMLNIDCHCEGDDLRDVLHFSGAGNILHIRGFTYREHDSHANRAVFACDQHISQVHIEHAQIEVAGYHWHQTCRVFIDPTVWRITGTYYSAVDESWNGNNSLTGTLFLGEKVALVGSWEQRGRF